MIAHVENGIVRTRHPRLLVLGATGFLGRAVARAAVTAGWEVFGTGRADRPAAPVAGLGYRPLADGADRAALTALLDDVRPDAVVNAAGTLWTDDAEQLRRGNVTAVAALVGSLGDLPGRRRVVQLGSMYERGPADRHGRPTAPTTAYGRTKAQASRILLDASARGTVDAVVLQLTTVLGPGLSSASTLGGLVTRLTQAQRQPSSAPLELEIAPTVRDYTDVRDAARAVLSAVTSRAAVGATVPVGSGRAVRSVEAAVWLADAAGVPARIREGAAATGWQYPVPDPSAALRLLGWRADHSLHDTMRTLVEAATPDVLVAAASAVAA